jgi:hypothetical protein
LEVGTGHSRGVAVYWRLEQATHEVLRSIGGWNRPLTRCCGLLEVGTGHSRGVAVYWRLEQATHEVLRSIGGWNRPLTRCCGLLEVGTGHSRGVAVYWRLEQATHEVLRSIGDWNRPLHPDSAPLLVLQTGRSHWCCDIFFKPHIKAVSFYSFADHLNHLYSNIYTKTIS